MKKLGSNRRLDSTQLMVVKNSKEAEFGTFASLDKYLSSQDLLVMNLSATIPGSFRVNRGAGTDSFEIRLAAFAGNSLLELSQWWAILLGAGDWRMPTEERGAAPELRAGEILQVSPRLKLKILFVDPQNKNLIKLSFVGEKFLDELYRNADPIQYSYQESNLAIWDVQTPLAQLPISVEAPSALFPFSWSRILALQKKFRVAFLYHGAGISSTGSSALDDRLPLPEFYSIPPGTVRAWRETRAAGGRVIAVGTSVARALESARELEVGAVRSLEGVTSLRVRSNCVMDRVDGMLTGYHDPLTSHFELEAAFVGAASLRAAFEGAERRGFQRHEFGDATLLLGK